MNKSTNGNLQPGGKGVRVSIDHIQKIYPRTSLHALNDISFIMEPGEVISIVGPSGCGKSTLLHIIAGLQHPTSGTVIIDDKQVTHPYEKMGIAFQNDNLLPWRTAKENVLLQADLRGWSRERITHQADKLLQLVGLEPYCDYYPQKLSGGMRQRVALCRALVHEPGLLLLDEPFGAVDALTREQLNVDVSALCALWRTTTLLVTHDISEAVFMGNRVLVMSRQPGRIAGMITVPLPQPRDMSFRKMGEYIEASSAVRTSLEVAGAFDAY